MQRPDVSAISPEKSNGDAKRRGVCVPGWLAGFLLIFAVTFIAGYYLPARAANQELTRQVQRLSNEYRFAIDGYEVQVERLTTVTKERDEMKEALGEISQAESSAAGALGKLHDEMSAALSKLSKAELLSVTKTEQSVSVDIEARYLIYPHKTFVHAQGKQLLCQIARALPKGTGQPTRVVAHAHGEKPSSSILEKQLPTSWQLSAVMASEVAAAIESCGVAGVDLRAVGAAHFEGEPERARKSAARFEIFVFPSSS